MQNEIDLLKRATWEMKSLRHQNEIMSARLEMFDNMMSVLHTGIATKSQGMSPDLVYEIEKFIATTSEVEN